MPEPASSEPRSSTLDPAEVARFARIASEWWDPKGKFRHFASHGSNGVVPVSIDSTPAGSGTGNASNNVQVTGNLSLSNAAGYSLNSLKLAPASANQSFPCSGRPHAARL